MKSRILSALRLLSLACLAATVTARAGIPEPDTVFFGSIALDGRYITATNTGVSVELRATANGPALRTYRMGSSARAGNLYALRATAESAPPLLQPGALALGSTVHVVVRDLSGVRDSKTHVLSERGGFVRLDFGDVDGDGDGMSDAFELTHFGNSTGGNPALDSDGDGRSNLQEFLDQTNPLVADGRHPADIAPANDAISIAEVTAYTLAWQLGEEWSVEPKVIPVNYVTRAGALWKGGEGYIFDNSPTTNAPMWWVNPPLSPALQADDHGGTEASEPRRSLALQSLASRKSGAEASRSAPANFAPAQVTPVRIQVRPDSATLSFAVEETPPAGWIIRNVSHGGRIDRVHQKIKWGPFYDTEPRELTYEVTALPGTSNTGVFQGIGSFNGRSLTLAGVQQVLPPGVSLPPTLASMVTGDGQFRLRLTGSPGGRYVIEASPDLQLWSPVQSVTADDSGALDYAVSQLGLTQRFFRARAAD
jgi:hypothetical protein